MMTFEEATQSAARKGLYVANLRQGTDGHWHCCLRQLNERPFIVTDVNTVYVRRGAGSTMAEAVMNAAAPQGFEDLF